MVIAAEAKRKVYFADGMKPKFAFHFDVMVLRNSPPNVITPFFVYYVVINERRARASFTTAYFDD